MKKTILFLSFALLFSFAVNAQFEIGQKMLGGSLQIYKNTVKIDSAVGFLNPSAFGFLVNPTFSRFVSDKKLFGFGILYMYDNESSKLTPNSAEAKSNTQSIGLNYFVTYYKIISGDFYFLINWDNAAIYSFGKSSNSSSEMTERDIQINTSVSPGIAYKVNNRFIIESNFSKIILLSYYRTEITQTPIFGQKGTASLSSIGLYSSLNGNSLSSIQIGFKYLLKK